METLSDADISQKLDSLSGWEREGDKIHRDYPVDDFVAAVELVNDFVEPAEDQNHHPDLEVSWGSVHVWLTTHDAGALTRKDFKLADHYNRIYEEGNYE